MSNPEVVAALKRARVRIGLNGWAQGSVLAPQRGVQRTAAMGWCLEDAVLGRGKRTTVGDLAQTAALTAISMGIAELYPEELSLIEAAEPPSVVAAWNDAPGRTKEEVLSVLALALSTA